MKKTILSFVAVCTLAPAGVGAQALPSIDATFTRRSADNDPDLALREGVLALQLHAGKPMWAEFKNIKLRELGK